MHRPLTFAAMLAAAACGATGSDTAGTLLLTSPAFADGAAIPAQLTCDGAGRSPALHWSGQPAATRSFAIVVDDPDAPGGLFRHWGAYDIPASRRAIAAGEPAGTQAVNDFGKPGFGGPCPPRGNRPHHYHFKLFALDVDGLDLGPAASVAQVEHAAKRHALATAELVGTYQRD